MTPIHDTARRINALTVPRIGFLDQCSRASTFGAVLSLNFWASALTKLGDGVFGFLFPSAGAYVLKFLSMRIGQMLI